MHVVAVNSARSTYRRLKNQAVVGGVSDALDDEPDPRTTSVIAGTRLDLLEAMETLERDHPQFVEPLLLRDVYGLPYDEIARAGRRPARHGQGPDPPRPQAGAADAARGGLTGASARGWPAAPSLAAGCSDSEPSREPRRQRPRPSTGQAAATRLPTARPGVRRASATRSRTASTPRWATPASTPSTTTSTSPGTPSGRRSPAPRRSCSARPRTTTSSSSTSCRRSSGRRHRSTASRSTPRSRTRTSWSTADVVADERYVVEIDYSGSPRAGRGTHQPADVALLGFTTMTDGEAWTLQEPFGAYTWYAVNDQPVRQGALRLHAAGARADGRHRQRRAAVPRAARTGRR